MIVWRKSLMFDCKGFAVFGTKGDLAYRINDYSDITDDEVVLMDTACPSIFTFHRSSTAIRVNCGSCSPARRHNGPCTQSGGAAVTRQWRT